MRFDSLEAWLAWQETLNPRGIDLGLDRVRRVGERLQLLPAPFRVLTVGGTNGKGSVAAYSAAILQAGGFNTGRYLSPHLLHYNERIAINGAEASDDELCAVFETVDRARGEEALTYFEFGTLAALELFRRRGVEVAVLEVGLGGRLDAVNVLDADAAVVVSVGMDHTDWLGDSIDAIAREKAGIFRPERPAFFGSRDIPEGLVREAKRIRADFQCLGEDFDFHSADSTWEWRGAERTITDLPAPLAGQHQYANATTAVAAVLALAPNLKDDVIRSGLAATRLAGRLQSLGGTPEFVIDVGHNADAAGAIAAYLQNEPKRTRVILGMLADKDVAAFVGALAPFVDHWHLVTLEGARGQTASRLAARLDDAGIDVPVSQHVDMAAAVNAVNGLSSETERVFVLGSFHTVESFLVYSGLDLLPGRKRG